MDVNIFLLSTKVTGKIATYVQHMFRETCLTFGERKTSEFLQDVEDMFEKILLTYV